MHPLSLKRKRLETLGLRRLITNSLNGRSRISAITVELQGILIQIATSGWPLNRATVWSHLETRISFHFLLLLLKIFLRSSCSFRTWTVSILPPHHQIIGSLNRKFLPRCGRKKAQSDLVTFSLSPSFYFCITYVFCFLVVE